MCFSLSLIGAQYVLHYVLILNGRKCGNIVVNLSKNSSFRCKFINKLQLFAAFWNRKEEFSIFCSNKNVSRILLLKYVRRHKTTVINQF